MSTPVTHLGLFGTARVTRDGRDVPLPVRKTLALIVYLCLEGRSSRARLAELFWGGLDEATARRNLRHALYRLRAAGLGDVLVADGEHVALAGVGSDLQVFERALASGDLVKAHALRTGPLFDALELEDAAEFDDWLRARREQFLRTWRTAMTRHAAQLEGKGDLAGAVAVNLRMLDDDALQESTYRDLMRLHDGLGERAAALELFARCERTLRDELGLEPLPQTRLLAERIRSRQPQQAAASAAAISAADQGRGWAPGVDLRTVPLVAREREVAAVAALLTSLVLIEGEAGFGKTRFAVEIARNAVSEGARDGGSVLVVRFTEMSASTPFYAVTDALRSTPARERLIALAPVWKQDITRLLPEIDLAIEQAGDEPAPTPAEARTRLLEALAQALALAAGPARTVVFDDLQWADASSLELLAHLARRHRQAPAQMVRVLATARDVELSGNLHAEAALRAIAGVGELSRLRLAAFDDWSMLQLVQRLSGSEGGVRFAARLLRATGGNVFFAIETIRTLFESGELKLDPGEGWSTRYDDTTTDYSELPLPASVIEAVRLRIARLGAAAQRVLETAALAEDGSTLAEIQGATALSEWEALDGIERAVAGQVVDRSGTGYRFVHDLFRSAIRSGLSPERQRLTHAKLAAALEPLAVSPARIAAHWEQAGQAGPAVKAWKRAAEAAVAIHAHREAIDHYGRAAALVSDDAQSFDLLDLRLERMRLANLAEGRAGMLAEMLALAQRMGSPTLQFRALARAADIATDERQMALAEQYALRALREFEPPDDVQRVHALSSAAFAAGFLDRPEDALERYLEALGVAQRSAMPRAQATMGACAALVAVSLDRLDQAAVLGDAALLASAAAPTSIHRGQALSQVSCVTRALGNRPLALAQLEEAVAIARSTRMNLYLAVFLANLCEALVDDGQRDAARTAQQACAEAFSDPSQTFSRYLSALTAAAVHELHGELGAAIGAARAAIAAGESLASLPDQRESRLLCARMLVQIGSVAPALELADTTDELVLRGRRRILLPAENVRAAAELASDPARAKERLLRALAEPFADRLLHPHLEGARVLLGHAELALHQPQTAREVLGTPRYSVALEAEGLTLRLAASAVDGRADPVSLDAALRLIDSDRLPPLHALALMRALASLKGGRGSAGNASRAAWHARMRVTAQALADSLRHALPLQAAFIRKHRDLLT